MATKDAAFEPEKIELEQKGKMHLLYSVTGKDRDHMATFFHEHKAKYVADAIVAHYGIKVTKKRTTETTVASKAPAKTKAKPAAKTPVKGKPRKK